MADISIFKDNVELVLAVSTCNVQDGDGKCMTSDLAPKRMAEHDKGFGALFNCHTLDAHDKAAMEAFGFSSHFIRIMADAHVHGFDRVYFDCDAPQLPDNYPTFEW